MEGTEETKIKEVRYREFTNRKAFVQYYVEQLKSVQETNAAFGGQLKTSELKRAAKSVWKDYKKKTAKGEPVKILLQEPEGEKEQPSSKAESEEKVLV